MSFILDALRKSEHERQRSTAPGLSQVPLATPQAVMPRWAFVVMGVLAVAVLALGGAWWKSSRAPAELTAAPTVERSLDLPPAPFTAPRSASPPQSAPLRALAREPASPELSLASAAGSESAPAEPADTPTLPPQTLHLPSDEPALPSAAALAAEGVALPSLRLELHAWSGQPKDRFVFINGRKYVEGQRLTEGPQLVSIEPTGAVLAHAGRRFLLVQD